jgi:hypothetical protein
MTEVFVLLPADNGGRKLIPVPLHNELMPIIDERVAPGTQAGAYVYGFTIRNGEGAKDDIRHFWLIAPPGNDPKVFGHPDGWIAGPVSAAVARQTELPGQPNGRYLCWDFEGGNDTDIKPGQTASPFGIESLNAPGFTTALFAMTKLLNLPQDWPDSVYLQLAFLEDPRWTNKAVLVIGPMFQPGTDSATVAKNYRDGLHCLFDSGRLDRDTPWSRQILSAISEMEAKAPQVSTTMRRIRGQAHSELEREITTALELTMSACCSVK